MTEPLPLVLVVDDERVVREGLVTALSRNGYRAVAASGLAEARRALTGEQPSCILLDIRLGDGDGLDFLAALRADGSPIPIVMATAYGDSDRTIQAMKAGAFDYVTKPFDLDALLAVVARASGSRRLSPASAPPETSSTLVGRSARMLEVWKIIGRAATTDAPVLILGESGVGKELVARAIHEHGARSREPFVAVNVAALPSGLVESELFGHERGAFTGAQTRREGRFEVASSGTIFLDEIGDLDVPMQTKLLRVLQDGTFERVGSQTPLVSRARVVAATSKPVVPGEPGATLREDLYYRLGVITIRVPPLRERKSDIPALVASFLARKRLPTRAISEGALERLGRYDWPGNVRELFHVVERAAVLSGTEVLDEGALDLPEPTGTISPVDGEQLDLRRAVERTERELIVRALARAGGNRAEAARLLGIARPQLYTKMKDLGIDAKRG